ncbi:hypothetical protein SNE40_008827 [Patella caerulea]|uniref:Strictosidine synthase conserved region domain-containing protein n=1 Tax=Patella caerulea TaxID=87958 RepID=A0AAN8JS84_PATCE
MYQEQRSNVRQRRTDEQQEPDSTDDRDTTINTDSKRSSGWCEFLASVILAVILLIIIILLVIPSPIEPKAFSVEKAPELTGALTPNTKLPSAQRVYIGEVNGPESICVDGEHVYTGTMDGKILNIHKGKVTVLAQLGEPPCGGFEDEPTCGRPLGMRLDHNGYLVVADAYLGLFKVNVATGDVHSLVLSTQMIGGIQAKFFNDLDIAQDGTIYFTDSSTKWGRRHNRYAIVEADDTGRLLKFNPKDKSVEQLVSGLSFANGVQLSSNEDFLLVCETTKYRIWKYHLQGSKRGEMEIFAENLPGIPDNIRRTPRGTYWVGLAGARFAGKFSFLDYAADKPWLRKIITKIVSQETLIKLVPKYGLLIELNNQGEIIRSFHDPTGEKVPAISEAEEKDGVVYLGSYNLPYMSKLNLQGL